jgi:hypothetical protein
MNKVKFREYQKKHNNGYIETNLIAYVDITTTARNIFGNIVRGAYQVISEYNELNETRENWKQLCKNMSVNVSENYIEVDNENHVIIEFTNGNIVEFFSSEWGHITKSDELI